MLLGHRVADGDLVQHCLLIDVGRGPTGGLQASLPGYPNRAGFDQSGQRGLGDTTRTAMQVCPLIQAQRTLIVPAALDIAGDQRPHQYRHHTDRQQRHAVDQQELRAVQPPRPAHDTS